MTNWGNLFLHPRFLVTVLEIAYSWVAITSRLATKLDSTGLIVSPMDGHDKVLKRLQPNMAWMLAIIVIHLTWRRKTLANLAIILSHARSWEVYDVRFAMTSYSVNILHKTPPTPQYNYTHTTHAAPLSAAVPSNHLVVTAFGLNAIQFHVGQVTIHVYSKKITVWIKDIGSSDCQHNLCTVILCHHIL